MKLTLGEKIRELRKRDGRKQEDLANALGVSNQAVSRWEKDGGYPDMELIPAIANYFNVSIDELFGYSKDRQEKLKSILDKAETAINGLGDMTECVELLRAAVGHVCHVNSVPFAVLRAISDSADDSSHMDYGDFVLLAAERSFNVISEFIKNE